MNPIAREVLTRDLSGFKGDVYKYDPSELNPQKHQGRSAFRALEDGNRVPSNQYSIVRAIRHLAGFTDDGKCFEREISRDIAARCGVQAHPCGLFLPTTLRVESRALKNDANAGAETVFTEPGTFIELLRNTLVTTKLGATYLPGLQGPIAFPKQTAPGTLEWVGEAPVAGIADSDATFSQVSLSPKAAMSSTSFTRQLLAQSSFDIENLVRQDLAVICALGIDAAALNGSGIDNQPRGILKTVGIGDVPIGAAGGNPTLGTFVDLESALSSANVPFQNWGYATTPGVRGYCKQTPIIAGMPVMVWGSNNEVNSYPAVVSNQIPSNLVKGGSNDCHAIIFGNWRDLLIGEWGVLEIIVDPYTLKKRGIIEVTVFIMADVGLRYPVSFAACQDARIV